MFPKSTYECQESLWSREVRHSERWEGSADFGRTVIHSVQLSIAPPGFPLVAPDSFSSSSLSSPAAAPAERPEFETSVDLNTALSADSSEGLNLFARVESFGGRPLPRLMMPPKRFAPGRMLSLSNRSGSPPVVVEPTGNVVAVCPSMCGINLALGNPVEFVVLGLMIPGFAVATLAVIEADPIPTVRECSVDWLVELVRPATPTTPKQFVAVPLIEPFMKLFN